MQILESDSGMEYRQTTIVHDRNTAVWRIPKASPKRTPLGMPEAVPRLQAETTVCIANFALPSLGRRLRSRTGRQNNLASSLSYVFMLFIQLKVCVFMLIL